MLVSLALVADATPKMTATRSSERAGEAAAKAAAKKSTKEKKKSVDGQSKKSALSFGGDMSWGKAANSKQTRATAPGHEIKAHWDAALGPVARVGYPWIEHHGTYRFRTQLFYNFDLDTYRVNAALNSSPFRPPLTEIDQLGNQHPESTNHRFGRDGESQSSANMRLRYQPTVHIADNLYTVNHGHFDNLVLGGTPGWRTHAQRSLQQSERRARTRRYCA